MIKRIALLIMTAVLLFTLASCMGSVKPNLESQANEEQFDYVKFIKDNASKIILGDKGSYKDADSYIASYKDFIEANPIELNKEIVELYVDSFSEYFGDGDKAALEAKAKDMIYREMAVCRAYAELGGKAIDTTDRDAMNKAAAEMAEKYSVKADAIYTDGGSTYIVETYIKYEFIANWFLTIGQNK